MRDTHLIGYDLFLGICGTLSIDLQLTRGDPARMLATCWRVGGSLPARMALASKIRTCAGIESGLDLSFTATVSCAPRSCACGGRSHGFPQLLVHSTLVCLLSAGSITQSPETEGLRRTGGDFDHMSLSLPSSTTDSRSSGHNRGATFAEVAESLRKPSLPGFPRHLIMYACRAAYSFSSRLGTAGISIGPPKTRLSSTRKHIKKQGNRRRPVVPK